MKPLEKKILNHLLDSYESSKLSRGENKVAVHISYAFNKRNIPEYFDESSTAYEEIHAMVRQLEERGFLVIEWKDKKVNHIIQKVTLREPALSEIYRYMDRIPKADREEAVLERLGQLLEADLGALTKAFLVRMTQRIKEGKSVKEYFDISKLKEVEEFVYILNQTEGNEEECFVREFSIQHLHDSKRFNTYLAKVCKVIREENTEFENLENEEILSEYQIYHTPSYVYVKGKVKLEMNSQGIDLNAFPEGLGFALNHQNVDDVQITAMEPVYSVYTIENLTTFFRFKKDNSLIIYLGGYHNRVRRTLLQIIYNILPDAKYYHFGDIDVGGFQIYYHLREKTKIPFMPYRMDLQTLQQYEGYGKKLTENDKIRLKKLMDTKMEDREKLCAEYMLNHNMKLEQECVTSF